MINRFLIEMCSNLLFVSMSWFYIFYIFWPCDIRCIKICAIDILGYTWIVYFIGQCLIFFIKFFFYFGVFCSNSLYILGGGKTIYMCVLFPNCMCVVCVWAIFFFFWLVFYSIYYLLIFKLFVHYKKLWEANT